MVDHNDHPTGLRRSLSYQFWSRIAKKLSQASHFLDPEVVCVRVLEERSLLADSEDELIASVPMNLTNPTDEVNSVRPAQIPRQFPSKQAGVDQVEIVTDMCSHPLSMSPATHRNCIGLLTQCHTLSDV
jgi:hypothetical protein